MSGKNIVFLIIITLVVLAATATAFSKLSDTHKLIAVLLAYGSLIILTILSKLSIEELGLNLNIAVKAIVVVAPFIGILLLFALLVFFIRPSTFLDTRYNFDTTTMLVTVLITIPIFTVLIEEYAFRGLLLGQLLQVVSPLYASIYSALAFGVWHVFSAQAFTTNTLTLPRPLLILLIVIATSIAGLFFNWLRIKSGSLLAPIFMHWFINSTGILFAFFAWKQST